VRAVGVKKPWPASFMQIGGLGPWISEQGRTAEPFYIPMMVPREKIDRLSTGRWMVALETTGKLKGAS